MWWEEEPEPGDSQPPPAQRARAASPVGGSGQLLSRDGCPLLELMAVADYREVLCEQLDTALLSRFKVSRSMRTWIDSELARRGVTGADVASGIQLRVLHRLCRILHREILLAKGEYLLVGNAMDVAHNKRGRGVGGRGAPQWRDGYGPLWIAKGVHLIGQEGVVLTGKEGVPGDRTRLEVRAQGVQLTGLHLPQGVTIFSPATATMQQCTSTGSSIRVDEGASLDMEDCRIFGSRALGVHCDGKMRATRCTIEGNADHGVLVHGPQASAELVDCVIRSNGSAATDAGVCVRQGKVMLRGGTVSKNKMLGARAFDNGKVTVAKADEDQPQTVSKDNERHEWSTAPLNWEGSWEGGEIIGIPQEKIHVGF